jgi:rare lipoprotein A
MRLILAISLLFIGVNLVATDTTKAVGSKPKIIYGTASFYANSFNGKKTANGETFSQKKMTAACNVLPLGTWIRVTNLRNGRSVLVRTNDRLHTRMKRVVDLSRSAAEKLNYVKSGLTQVKVEVLGKKKPEE